MGAVRAGAVGTPAENTRHHVGGYIRCRRFDSAGAVVQLGHNTHPKHPYTRMTHPRRMCTQASGWLCCARSLCLTLSLSLTHTRDAYVTPQGIGKYRARLLQEVRDEETVAGVTTQDKGEVKCAPPAEGVDWRRQFAIYGYAGMYQAPFGHVWYPLLERAVGHLKMAVPLKVIADQIVDAPIANLLYMGLVPL